MAGKTFEYDLGYAQSALEEMESYLLSDEVFWPISGNPPNGGPAYPRLTLGSLLLTERRLKGYDLNPNDEAARSKVISEIERLRSKWRVRWEMKAKRSFSVRQRMWGYFLEEYRSNSQENAGQYAYAVRLRAILELLREEGGGQTAEIQLLAVQDKSLRPWLESDGFIWEAEVQNGFPKDKYWYLYGKLRRTI